MSDLNLRALHTVAAIGRSGSLSRAAATLGVAQSVASRHLSDVEAALGGALFHRTGRGVTPTEMGAEALPRLHALLHEAQALTLAMRERAGVPGGPVTLGLVPSLAATLTSALWAELARLHPQLQLRVREGYSGEMEAALADGRVDLAVVNRYRARGNNRYRALFDTPLCVVGRPAVLRPALGGARTWPDQARLPMLASLPLVMPLPPNPLRSLLDEEAQRTGLHLQVMVEAGTSVVIKRLLRDHACATVLPRHAVADELACGELAAVPLAERAMRQHVVLATSPQRPFTEAARAVARLLPEVVRRVIVPLATPL
jgi:LysR family nitrogen assimilation transcriptional regulator